MEWRGGATLKALPEAQRQTPLIDTERTGKGSCAEPAREIVSNHSTHNANDQLAVCSKLGPWPQLGIGNKIKVLNWHWIGIETTEGKPRLNLQSQPPHQIPTVNYALGVLEGGLMAAAQQQQLGAHPPVPGRCRRSGKSG